MPLRARQIWWGSTKPWHGFSIQHLPLSNGSAVRGEEKNELGEDHMPFFKLNAILLNLHPSLGLFCRGVPTLFRRGRVRFAPVNTNFKVGTLPYAADRPLEPDPDDTTRLPHISATNSSPPDVGFPKALHLYFFYVQDLLTSTLLLVGISLSTT